MDGVVSEDFQQHEREARDQDRYLKYKENVASHQSHRNLLEGLKPAMTMVVVQIIFGGLNIMYKLARNDGMSMKILVAYRNIFATAIMVPLALIFEGKSRPKLTWMIFLQGSLCGLFGGAVLIEGSLGQNLYAESLSLTSATFVAAMTNLVPAMTFVMAVFLRMERLAIGTIAGKAKLMGTIMSLGGAMILTFYKGVEIKLWSTNINLLHHVWLIVQVIMVQTKMSMVYPSYSGTALIICCIAGSVGLWINGYTNDLGFKDERPIVCIFFLSLNACNRCNTWVTLTPRTATYRKHNCSSVDHSGLVYCFMGKGKEMKQTARIHAAQSFSEQDLRHIVIENSSNSECKPEASGIIGPIEPADLGSGVPSAAAVVNK
ncbi:WAT1-related protein [Vitis vinifera]|uniref:WAT1-related protein n=1 Tax=Vitis vinifera TaxID=29760 RepID=A0A438HMI2_VITVI|nr:WAT1-related protein [Vitis vinifera]